MSDSDGVDERISGVSRLAMRKALDAIQDEALAALGESDVRLPAPTQSGH